MLYVLESRAFWRLRTKLNLLNLPIYLSAEPFMTFHTGSRIKKVSSNFLHDILTKFQEKSDIYIIQAGSKI